jgi:hypothetical protein
LGELGADETAEGVAALGVSKTLETAGAGLTTRGLSEAAQGVAQFETAQDLQALSARSEAAGVARVAQGSSELGVAAVLGAAANAASREHGNSEEPRGKPARRRRQ